VGSHEVVGVGFGPANLGLAIALREFPHFNGVDIANRSIFFEQQPAFGWHTGMLLEKATMQVSFLKDLVSMRNPSSPFSYVSYLHEQGRLSDFVNNRTLYPYRTEFHDYLQWSASRLDSMVRYAARVSGVRPVFTDGVAHHLDVFADIGGVPHVARTRNLVVGTGLTPRLPAGVSPSERVWHSSELLDRLPRLEPGTPRSFAVVGAGQSAAEVVEHLHSRFPGAEVHAVFSRYGYSVADDSPFANRVFDPAAVDDFWQSPEDIKERILGYHAGTNYAVVDLDLIEQLHAIAYQEGISGRRRLHFHNASRVTSVEDHPDGVDVTVEHLPTSQARRLRVDALIYATGYAPSDPLPLLADVAACCKTDDQGRLVLARDYQVITSDTIQCGIYVHGGAAEHTHGLSAGLLSTVAVRAGEITRSIADHVR
jgi:L-ornithine N5-oxygenase